MRDVVKQVIEKVPPHFFERALGLSILRTAFYDVRSVKSFDNRKALWANVFAEFEGAPVDVLEFGVFMGSSMGEFARLNDCADSRFFGFDSFLGLPEDWTSHQKKGAFNVNKSIPQISDSRVSFVDGWFQNTLPRFLSSFNCRGNLFVHYDADIYSATLFVLMQVDTLKTPYYAVFDEFFGHEPRALYSYLQMSGATVEFIAKVGNDKYPTQVSCKITPSSIYVP